MINKKYEYFGNQSPLMNARYNRARLDAQRAANIKASENNWRNDPWYNLGSAIGQAWADNYNERGISKGREEMGNALGDYLNQAVGGQQQPGQANYNPSAIRGEDAGMGSGFITYADGANMPDSYKYSAPAEGALASGVVMGSMMGQGSPYFDKDGNFNMQQPDLAGARTMYRYNKYLNSDNPDTEATQNKQDIQTLGQMGNNIDFDNINKEDAREYVRKQLESKGRTSYQIEQVLGQFDNTYDAKQKQWGVSRATDWMNEGAKAAAKGDYLTASRLIAKAGRYRPEEAKASLSEVVYQRNLKDKIAAEQRAIQNKRDQYIWELDEQKRRGIGAYKPVVSRTSSGGIADMTNPFIGMYETTSDGRLVPKKFKLGGSQYSSQDYANALKALTSEGVSDNAKAQAQAIVDDYLNSGAAKEFTMTNPVEQLNALKYIDRMELTPKGKIQYAIDHGVNVGPMFGQFVSRLGWNSPANDIVYDDDPNMP